MVYNMVSVHKPSAADGSQRAARALRDVLARAAHGRATVISGESGPTFTLKHGTGLLAIVPFWAGAGYPAEIERVMRSAEWADVPAGATRMIVGRKISAASRTAIERGGASWADEAGRMLLDAPPLLLIIDDPSPAAELQALRRARPTTVRWTAGAGAVAEVVLGLVADRASAEPDTPGAQLPKIATLAGLAGLSAPFVSRTLRAFDDAGWTTKSGPARGTSTVRDVTDPTSLLSAWAQWYSAARRPPVRTHGLIRDADAFLREVGRSWPRGRWALTGGLALEHRAPFFTNVPVIDLYLDRMLLTDQSVLYDLLSSVGLRRVTEGARVQLFEAEPSLLAAVATGDGGSSAAPEVGDIRLYGDLLASGVRGQEAAEHLRQTRIGF